MDAAMDLASVLSTVEEPWSPRTVTVLNDYDVRVVKAFGEFTPHSHPDTDEFFLVLRGTLTIKMARGDVTWGPARCSSSTAVFGTSPCRRRARRSC